MRRIIAADLVGGVRRLAVMGAPPAGPFDGKIGPARRFATAHVPFSRCTPRSPGTRPRSTSSVGNASRSFMSGSSEWPPASSLASSPPSFSAASTPSSESGAV